MIHPEKKIDEEWKKQIKLEKEKLEKEPKDDDDKLQEFENEFVSLLHSLVSQLESAMQAEQVEIAQKIATLIKGLDYKTKDKQTLKETGIFAQVIPQIQMLLGMI